ncbi:Hypothetical protein D9617_2g057250 [Elsinoe fawcettii]|nr:Hypothetical protein D9617_2g057250 [Elsinoe fawcettii]
MAPEVHSFSPITSPPLVPAVLSLLRAHLPLSIPIYRRMQFAHFTSVTRIILSFPPSLLSNPNQSLSTPWLISYSDPDRGPETQIFLFGSWEVANPPQPSSEQGPADSSLPEHDPAVIALLRAYITHIRDSGLYLPSTSQNGTGTAQDGGEVKQQALIGSVHESTVRILHSFGILDPKFIDEQVGKDGLPERCNKWIFDLHGSFGWEGRADGQEGKKGKGQRTFSDADLQLPEGLRWGEVRAEDYPLVRSRTSIGRQDRTLRMLPSAAIFQLQEGDGKPIAWAFLGVDSSLTSLHVEPEWRGRGLAKKLALKVWKENLGWYVQQYKEEGSQGEWLAHADVATWNAASNGMCKSLGGYTEWTDYWFRANLDAI